MEQVEKIAYNGVAPWMIWVTIVTILALCAAIAAVWKVVQISRDEKKRRAEEMAKIAQREVSLQVDTLAEDISAKVTENVSAKFADIDRKLAADKERIESQEKRANEHDRALERIEKTLDSVDANIRDMREGMMFLSRATIATLNHQRHNGNGDELDEAAEELNRYLTARPTVPIK